jgi:hypothetical protein
MVGGYGGPEGPRPRYASAWHGTQKRTMFLGERLFPIPRHPPTRGGVEEHPYQMDYGFEHHSVYSWYSTPPGSVNTRTSVQDGGTGTLTAWGWTANDDISLLGKLRTGVAGSDFNLGVFLGEGSKALEMMAGTATGIFNAYNHARRGNMVAAAKALWDKSRHSPPKKKVVANNWLELQYGWLPLVNDVYEGAIFLAHHLNVPLQQIYRVRRRVGGQTLQIGNTFAWKFPDRKVRESKSIKAIIKEKNVVQLSGLTDPLPVLWELLPYSFIVDWFIPIGNYLHARGLASAIEGTFVTSLYRYYDSGKGVLNPGLNYNQGTNEYHRRLVSLTRTVSTSLNVPLPNFKPLGDVPSWRRAANGIALGIQKSR